MKKFYLSLWTIAVLLLCAVSVTAQTYSGGAGTQSAPYQIANKADYDYLATHSSEWSKHFELTADITFDGQEYASCIATREEPFTGSFDGKEFTISNLRITGSANVGMFARLNGATIKNVTLIDADIKGNGNNTAGISAAIKNSSVVSNCFVQGKIYGYGAITGGIAGYLDNNSRIEKCGVDIEFDGSDFQYTGGIAAFASSAIVSECFAIFNCTKEVRWSGGIIGYADNCTLSNSGVYMNIAKTSDGRTGAITGTNKKTNVSNSFAVYIKGGSYSNTVMGYEGHGAGEYTGNYFLGNYGDSDTDAATMLTLDEFADEDNFTDWDSSIWNMFSFPSPKWWFNIIPLQSNGGNGGLIGTAAGFINRHRQPTSFTKEGYDFIGWSTTPDGNVEYTDNGIIAITKTEGNTLYAVWQPKYYTTEDIEEAGAVVGVRITDYSGPGGDVVIPSAIDHKPVLEIGVDAFRWGNAWGRPDHDQRLTSVAIPNTVTRIQQDAFKSNALESLIIPRSVQFIDMQAFCYNKFTNVTFEKGSNLESIGMYAFAHCDKLLKQISLPSSVKTIGIHAFENNGLENVSFEEGSQLETISDDVFRGNFIGSITIPKSVKTIGSYAFIGNSLTKVTFENNANLETIGKYAFYNNSIEGIAIPKKVTSISQGAFANNSLTKLIIPASVTSLGAAAFAINNNLTDVTIHNPNVEFLVEEIRVMGNLEADYIFHTSDDLENFTNLTPLTLNIYGYKGSTAQTYADKYAEHTFVAPYTVTFDLGTTGTTNDETVFEDIIHDSAMPTAPSVTANAGWKFTGWDVNPLPSTVTKTATYTAQYTELKYTVRFEDYDGSLIEEQTVNYGSAATAPTAPTREGYTFTSWDVAFDNVTADITVTAKYDVTTALPQSSENKLNIYPNPATTQVTVANAAGEMVSVFSLSGTLVKQVVNISNAQTIEVSNLAKGVYMLKVGATSQKLVIK